MLNIANILSASRLIIAPLLLFLAWSGRPGWFLFFVFVALGTDLADGYFARKNGQASELGARLDSAGDVAVYLTAPIAIWRLWPAIVAREAPYVAAALICFFIPLLVGLMKFRRFPSYHTWGTKLSAALLSPAILLLLLNGPAWPFHLATMVFMVAEIEKLLISILLTNLQTDVPSVFHALRRRNGVKHEKAREE